MCLQGMTQVRFTVVDAGHRVDDCRSGGLDKNIQRHSGTNANGRIQQGRPTKYCLVGLLSDDYSQEGFVDAYALWRFGNYEDENGGT